MSLALWLRPYTRYYPWCEVSPLVTPKDQLHDAPEAWHERLDILSPDLEVPQLELHGLAVFLKFSMIDSSVQWNLHIICVSKERHFQPSFGS